MKNQFKIWAGFVYFLIILGPNVYAQDQFVEQSVFDPIKFQMKSIADENVALTEKNKSLKAQLIGFQLKIEREEEIIKDLDPEYIPEVKYSREQNQPPSVESMEWEDFEDSALIEEAQEIFLSGQRLDLNENQRLEELLLYDLQYQKQELKLELQEKQALQQEAEERRHKELQAIENDIQESINDENDLRLKAADAEKKALSYSQNIDLLKMENEALKKKIEQLRNLLSQ